MQVVKIKSVDIHNLKAVSKFTAFFDGKSAHVTGANGKGKSTVIRALTDRLRGLKPEIITKIGETKGKTITELTDGCKFVWEYNNNGQDKLSYFAPNTHRPARREVFKSMCRNYFPSQFDINKFLTTTEPAKRLKMISELINVDLSEVQLRYKTAFELRKDAKKALKLLEDQIIPRPSSLTFENDDCTKKEQAFADEIKEGIDEKKQEIRDEKDRLNAAYVENKKANDKEASEHKELYVKELNEWLRVDSARKIMVQLFNDEQNELAGEINDNRKLLDEAAEKYNNTFLDSFFDFFEAKMFINKMPKPKNLIYYKSTIKPELTELIQRDPMPLTDNLDRLEFEIANLNTELEEANKTVKAKESELSDLKAAKKVYDLQLKQYTEHQAKIKEHFDHVQECEGDVLLVLNKIKAIIGKTELPEEFSIDLTNRNDILFRVTPDAEYLPITNETLASSAIFIAAFKLQANYLTAFRVAHFDVSYLDFENRKKVLDEAAKMGIQLITESPAMSEKEMELQFVITED